MPDVPVVVAKSRYEAGRLAEREGLGDLFILDDGFQHRGLYRDFDLVTIDPEEWLDGEALLPAGVWREPKDAIHRAHAACIQMRTRGVPVPDVPIPSFWVTTRVQGLWDANGPVPPESLRGKDVVAFAGIAKPERFFESLESIGVRPSRVFAFGDHRRFTSEDIAALGGDVRITTEKDAVRLPAHSGHFLCLRVSANIPDLDGLLDLILQRVRNT